MKCFAVVAVVVVVALAVPVTTAVYVDGNGGKDVFKFKIEDYEPSLLDSIISLKQKENAVQLKSYKFKNCGNPKTDVANVSSIVLGPDPVVFPGPLTVSFQVNISQTLDAPLKGSVVLSKKLGDTWIKIPCIGKIGSCNYTDVCDLLKNAQCPAPFVSHSIPCKCPFTKGNYKLPSSEFIVEVAVFPTGDYHAVGKLSTGDNKSVACVELFVTFG